MTWTLTPSGTTSGMRLDAVQAFVAVVEERSFTRAAARLYLSQSGLSRRIEGLERCLGAPLLDRTRREVALTAAGEVVLPYARVLLEVAQQARDAVEPTRT